MSPALGASVTQSVAAAALPVLAGAVALILYRLVRGPTSADRVLALDLMTMVATGLVACLAIQEGSGLYLDLAVVLVLVNFMATVAFARYIARPRGGKDPGAR